MLVGADQISTVGLRLLGVELLGSQVAHGRS